MRDASQYKWKMSKMKETVVIKIGLETLEPDLNIDLNPKAIDHRIRPAAQAIAQGKLIVFPTETVYGLGANALDNEAVESIFKAKGRPSDNPLIVHISEKSQLDGLVQELPPKAEMLMEAFWPGPLTLILRKSDQVPRGVTAGLDTVGIRMPAHPVALSLIRQSGIPIAAPSANLSGRPSPTQAEHVLTDLNGRVDFIIDGGSCEVGLESTVLDVTVEPPVILRPGGITREMLEEVIGRVDSNAIINGDEMEAEEDSHKPRAPGMKYRHYAPAAEMYLVVGNEKKVVEVINNLAQKAAENNKRVGIMAADETLRFYNAPVVVGVGPAKALDKVASGIYRALRQFDREGVDVIFSEGYPEKGLGVAIMNRLKKACGGKILDADNKS